MNRALLLLFLLGAFFCVACRTPNKKTQTGNALKAVYVTGPETLPVETCQEYRVVAETYSGEAYPLALEVPLSVEGKAAFFSNPACSEPLEVMKLAPGQGSGGIFLNATRGEFLTLLATPQGIAAFSLSVRATAASELSFLESEHYLPTQSVGQTTIFSIKLSNLGKGTARNIRVTAPLSPFVFAGGFYPGTGGTCTRTLEDGSDCTLIFVVTPSQVGQFNAVLQLGYEDDEGNGDLSLGLQGEAKP